jgi:endonuclease III
VKNATQCEKKLTALLKTLPEAPAIDMPDQVDPIAVIIQSFLLWESTTEKAATAYKRLREHVVDYNDLRVSMPHEAAEYIGSRYPRAVERCQRIRATLRNIYLREHAMTLERVAGTGKREIKKYVESLEGILPYVEARVLLLCFDTHAIPVDDQLRDMLADAGAADPDSDPAEVSSWLARQVKAKEGLQTHLALQAWADQGRRKPARAGSSKKTAAKAAQSASKTTTKKPPARKKTTTKKTAATGRKKS